MHKSKLPNGSRELLYVRVYTVDSTLCFVSRHPFEPPPHFTALSSLFCNQPVLTILALILREWRISHLYMYMYVVNTHVTDLNDITNCLLAISSLEWQIV